MCAWDRLLRASLNTCEPDMCGWMVHPAESASAFGYLVVAFLLWRRYGREDVLLPVRYFPALIALAGFGSIVFHSSFAAAFQALDLSAISPLMGYLVAATLVHRQPGLVRFFTLMAVGLAVGGGLLPFIALWLGFAALTMKAVLVIAGLVSVTEGKLRSNVQWVLALLVSGVILLVLDHNQIGCVRGSLANVIQPHVVWHILSAVSCVYLYQTERVLERHWSWPVS
jgi:hypothetical protein